MQEITIQPIDEVYVRSIVYQTIDSELAAYGTHCAGVRSHIYMWREEHACQLTNVLMHALNVVHSGEWLRVRSDDVLERTESSFYVSSFDDVREMERLEATIMEETDSLWGLETMADVRHLVRRVLQSLPGKLHAIARAARSKDPRSASQLVQWTRRWKDEVLRVSADEVRCFEAELSRLQEMDESETRKGVLSIALGFEESAIQDNPFGSVYFQYRDDVKELVRAISGMRGNEQGDDLDALQRHAKRYEWLRGELDKLCAAPAQPALPMNVTIHNGKDGIVQISEK